MERHASARLTGDAAPSGTQSEGVAYSRIPEVRRTRWLTWLGDPFAIVTACTPRGGRQVATGKGRVVGHPTRYEAEVALAERAYDQLGEWVEGEPLPEAEKGGCDVHRFLEAVCEVLRFEDLEEQGEDLSEEQATAALDRLKDAMERFSSWPSVYRYQVTAPLVEALESVDLEWLALELLTELPDVDLLSPEESASVQPAFRRLLPVYIRILDAQDEWVPEVEELLRALWEVYEEDPDDEVVADALERGLILNAVRSRQRLLLDDRRRLVANEPLPQPLQDAAAQLRGEVHNSDLIECGFHLLLSDAIAAGVLPEGLPPKQIVAAAMAYLMSLEMEPEEVNVHSLALWAGTNVTKISKLMKRISAVSEWQPQGEEGPLELRHHRRWLTSNISLAILPVRWTPRQDSDRSTYRTAAAEKRLEDLREVAWLMIDPLEPVRFVSEAFVYGNDASDEMDEHIVVEALRIWREECVVDALSLGDLDDDDPWEDDLDEE